MSENIVDNKNVNKRQKLNNYPKIYSYKIEILPFLEKFERIIIHNIYDCFKDDNIRAKEIVDNTNFFSTIDDMQYLIPILISVIKNNDETRNYIIYITILFLYYGLVLLDQTYNFLYTSDIKKWFNITDNEYDKIYNLIIEISSSNKIYAKNIRKILFNL